MTTHQRTSPALSPSCLPRTGHARKLGRAARREASVTWRMLADNILVDTVPPLLFALGACFHAHLSTAQTLSKLGEVLALFVVFSYVFDTSNQAQSADEDRLNKPYRPIPAGLITAAGVTRRLWIAMPLCALLGWQLGVLEWALLWQVPSVLINLVCTPRNYLWGKTLSIVVLTTAMLAASWQVVAPLDATAVLWIATIIPPYSLALIYEDVRDMAGDRAIGRRTPALVVGEWPIRIWFAAFTLGIPVLLHFVLFAPAETSAPWRVAVCDVILAAMSWTCAARALLLHHHKADRLTYQLFILSFATALSTGAILWA